METLKRSFINAFGVEPVDVSVILGRDRRISSGNEQTKDGSKGAALPSISTDSYLGFDLRGIQFIDDSWLVSAADTMRPYIRGFIVLLMIFYNFNQYLSFIGAGNLSSLGSAINSHQPLVTTTEGTSSRINPSTGEITGMTRYSSTSYRSR